MWQSHKKGTGYLLMDKETVNFEWLFKHQPSSLEQAK
jgi:hypothetical protein